MFIREKKDIPYYQDELYHYGVKGMKWGVRRKTKRLNYLDRNADRFDMISKSYALNAKALKNKGPIEYSRNFNKIRQLESNSKQCRKYSEMYRKRAARYMKKLSKDYQLTYDVMSGQYYLKPKFSNQRIHTKFK